MTCVATLLAAFLSASPAFALSGDIKPEDVERAEFKPGALRRSKASPLALRLQVLLDRAHASPGAIDGVYGASTIQAVRNFQIMSGMEATGEVSPELWSRLLQAGGDAHALKSYEIAKDDVKGPFAERIPDDYVEKAKLERLSYTSAAEGLAEKFHMDEDFLRKLNAGKSFDTAGETIWVVDAGARAQGEVKRIEVDGREKVLRTYAEDGKVIAAYPATVGSNDNPSPSGTLKVRAVAERPTYTYDPDKLNFKNVKTDEKLTIAPGPNNPVGLIWIDLDKDTYGIHGTPEPADIGKESSHGCVRLTNWDAQELASMVKKGVTVEFVNVVAAR